MVTLSGVYCDGRVYQCSDLESGTHLAEGLEAAILSACMYRGGDGHLSFHLTMVSYRLVFVHGVLYQNERLGQLP